MLVAPLPGLLACRAAVERVPAHGVLTGESRVAGIAGVFTDLNVDLDSSANGSALHSQNM